MVQFDAACSSFCWGPYTGAAAFAVLQPVFGSKESLRQQKEMSSTGIVLDLAIAQRKQAESSQKNDADVFGVGSDAVCLGSPDLLSFIFNCATDKMIRCKRTGCEVFLFLCHLREGTLC